jgi:hypothetical protein
VRTLTDRRVSEASERVSTHLRGKESSVTVWELLAEAVAALPEPFGRRDVLRWFAEHHPEIKAQTISAHLQVATSNAPAESRGAFLNRTPLVTRVGRGQYVAYRADREERQMVALSEAGPQRVGNPQDRVSGRFDIVLVSCGRAKQERPSRAADLYTSDGFHKRRALAEVTGDTWFILSAEHGLVSPDEWLAPYDLALSTTPGDYRAAWGQWVTARLAHKVGGLRAKSILVLAPAPYADAIVSLLASSGATVENPLAGLRQGEQLSWLTAELARRGRATVLSSVAPYADPGPLSVDELLTKLRDDTLLLSPAEFLASDDPRMRMPGLYSWWVDAEGAKLLSVGLGRAVDPGLVYAGLAGATRSRSGRKSANTLRGRIGGMHLGGRHDFSTFRLSLGSILAAERGQDRIDEGQLTAWMHEHLRLIAVPVDDADTLDAVETEVIAALDPPLNIDKRPKTALRGRLTELRRTYSGR